MYLFIQHNNVCDAIKICYVVVHMKFVFGIENTL